MTKNADITFQNNAFSLIGELDFSNVMSVYQKSLVSLPQCAEYNFDFSQVKDSNSAGIALIVEWIKLAKLHKKPIQLKSISKEMLDIAKAAGLNDLIQLQKR